jgi:hypothetical protein
VVNGFRGNYEQGFTRGGNNGPFVRKIMSLAFEGEFREICWLCVILFAWVCVGMSDSTNTFDDPSSSVLCVMCIGCFLGGS